MAKITLQKGNEEHVNSSKILTTDLNGPKTYFLIFNIITILVNVIARKTKCNSNYIKNYVKQKKN